MIGKLRSILRDDRGASAVLFAVALPPLMGVAAVSVDMGSLYLAERQLQGVADAAAAAGVGAVNPAGEAAAVAQAITDSGADGITVQEMAAGEYVRDRSIEYRERFDSSSPNQNALRVVLKQDVPLFFGRLLTGTSTSSVTAQATATRINLAGFMLGTRVLQLPPVANNLLSALAGAPLNLSQLQLNLLASTNIEVVDFAAALGPLVGQEGATFGEILEAGVPLNVAVQAMADASGNSALTTLLDKIALDLGDENIDMSTMFDLGPLADSDVNDGHAGAAVDSYSLLRAMLEASLGESYMVNLDTSIVGLAAVKVRLAGGHRDVSSPWLSINTMNEVTLRTSETRLLVQAQTNPILGLPSLLNIPLYVELAPAEATVTDIVCDAGAAQNGVYVSAKPSIGTIAIANPGTTGFDNFSVPLTLRSATLLNAQLVSVTGFSKLALGGNVATTLRFSPDDIAHRRTKSVRTTDLLTGATASVARDVKLDVHILGLGLGLGPVASLVGSTLNTVAPGLDGLVNQLTSALGVKLGVADVTVDRMRCGRPTIVG